MTQIKAVEPKFKMFDMPIWWHHHGSKIRWIGMDNANSPENRTFLLESSAVKIRIYPAHEQKGWIVEYTIKHSLQSRNSGIIWMSKEDLETAFGLSDACEEAYGQGIINDHGGEVAHQGMYLRYHHYLNIPGPGTGHDGDANVSIDVDPDIKGALKHFLSRKV
jgi:hypothetical protein